jgi:Mor family transcriptional regulator
MLNLYYENIANWRDTCLVDDPERPGEKRESPFNLAMGIFMMHTGIQKLTEANAEDFYMRAKLVEACVGSMFTYGDGTHYYLTPEDVHKYIGLASNVSAYTDAQFFSHLRKDVAHELRRTYKLATQHHRDAALVKLGEHLANQSDT